METYRSGSEDVRIERREPATSGSHPALLLVHGSGGAVPWWLDRFAPALTRFGVALCAPHYFDKTGTVRATAETILDGRHFPAWMEALRDAIVWMRSRPSVDAQRIGILGISLGGYLAVALGLSDPSLRLVMELSGGIPPGWEDRVTSAAPPMLILHGARDSMVPVSEAQKLEALLRERGVRYQVEIFPDENHWFSAASTARLLMTCGGFMARHL
jgi:dienelactone hydrolase